MRPGGWTLVCNASTLVPLKSIQYRWGLPLSPRSLLCSDVFLSCLLVLRLPAGLIHPATCRRTTPAHKRGARATCRGQWEEHREERACSSARTLLAMPERMREAEAAMPFRFCMSALACPHGQPRHHVSTATSVQPRQQPPRQFEPISTAASAQLRQHSRGSTAVHE